MNERMLSRRLRGLILIGWTVLLAALAAAGLSPWDLHAQPVFRSASSSLTASPQFRNATSSASSIVFRAPGFQTAGIGSSITPAIPAGTQAGDFAVLIVAGRPASTTQPAAPAGWTLRSWSFREVGANDLAIMTFYRVLTGGDANPTVNFPAAWQGASAGASAQIAVWAGVDAAAPFDVPDVTGNSAPGVSWTPPSITTVTSGAWVVSAVATSDDNDLRVQASAEFTPRMLTVFYDTTQGGDHSVALADKVQGTPGTPAMLTWSQAVNQSDPWAGITFVLRPVSNITIPSPGPAHQDVMIASIAFSPSTAAVTAPAAWIQVRRIDNGAGTSNSLVVYRKTASSPEPDTYSWTLSGEVTAMAGGIQSFSGVDGTAVIDVENGEATPSGLTHSTPSVTTTTDNTLVVSSHTFSSSQPWTAPSGMTESFDIGSSTPPGSVGQSIAASRVLQPFAGATGIKTATAAGDPDTGNTHILALKPAQPTLTINRPSGTVLNDVMLAAIGVGGVDLTITPPSGWALVKRIDNSTESPNSLAIYLKIVGSEEPSSYPWTITSTSTTIQTRAVGGIQVFSGVDTTTPIDVESGQSTVSGNTHSTPSVITTVPNTMLVTSHTYAQSSLWDPPSGMTKGFDISTQNAQSIEGSYAPKAAAGSTGPKTASATTGQPAVGNAHILALRPATASPPPPSQVFFIHTDHLNTPRLISNQAGQPVWRQDNVDPFGGNVPDENPSGLGTFTCNLRFPGQYADQETGIFYNYHRWYDPAIGRYTQFDLIGLAGGINGYLYVVDPLTQIDPEGLMGRAAGPGKSAPGPVRFGGGAASLNKPEAPVPYCDGRWMRVGNFRRSAVPGLYMITGQVPPCWCDWNCRSCPGGSDITANPPIVTNTTKGFLFFSTVAGSQTDPERGDTCLCSRPGPEKGCSGC